MTDLLPHLPVLIQAGSTAILGSIPGIPGNSFVEEQNPIVPLGPTLGAWRPIGDSKLSLSILHPLSDALPVVMQVDFPDNATGEIGFLNEGWWGMDISPQQYNASFFILGSARNIDAPAPSHVDVSLRSNLTGNIWSSSEISIHGNISQYEYTFLASTIHNNVTAPNSNNSFVITFNGSEVAGATFYFSLLSLFPETYNDRPNGLRKDLAEPMRELSPGFLRFPGGNNLEGYSTYERWKWWQTIGSVQHNDSSTHAVTDSYQATERSQRTRGNLGVRKYRRSRFIGVS